MGFCVMCFDTIRNSEHIARSSVLPTSDVVAYEMATIYVTVRLLRKFGRFSGLTGRSLLSLLELL